MTVLFLGGPLDGELREESRTGDVLVRPEFSWELHDYRYHISNGIARHESVSEEEVARRVHGWRLAAMRLAAATRNEREQQQFRRISAEADDLIRRSMQRKLPDSP